MKLKSLFHSLFFPNAAIFAFLILRSLCLHSSESFYASVAAAKELGSSRNILTYKDKSNVIDVSSNNPKLKESLPLEKHVVYQDSGNFAFAFSVGYDIASSVRAETEIAIELKDEVANEGQENFTNGGYISSWLINLTYLPQPLTINSSIRPFFSFGLGIGVSKINGNFDFHYEYSDIGTLDVLHHGSYSDSVTTGLGVNIKAGLEYRLAKSTSIRMNYSYRGLFHTSNQGKITSAATPVLYEEENLFFSIDKNNLTISGLDHDCHYIDLGFVMVL